MYKIDITNFHIFKYLIMLVIILSCIIVSPAQIMLNNPSFEDTPSDATVPMGWFECVEYTTPDILPGFWGVYNEASDGETYVGMITRENKTWEGIGQRLSKPMKAEQCYEFSIDLAHSATYAGYNDAIKLKIWISDSKCARQQLILETEPVKNIDWKRNKIQFAPEQDAYYIFLEVVYPKTNARAKGNMLLDNCSSIRRCGQV